MTAERELSKALEEACRAAVLLTGIAKAAEFSVLSGIAALERGDIADNVVRVETAAAAIQWRAKLPTQSAPALVQPPRGFQWLFLYAPTFRNCVMLRVSAKSRALGCRTATPRC
jgi:hypothetical protein